MQPSILSAPSVLSFTETAGSGLGEAVWGAYFKLTQNKFRSLINILDADAPGFAAYIEQSEIMGKPRFVLAPEASHIAHHVIPDQKDLLREILDKSVQAEAARNGQEMGEYPAFWTILGDFFISKAKEGQEQFTYHAPRLHGKIPVDFISPYCAFMRNEELGEDENVQIEDYPIAAFEQIVSHLEAALLPISRMCPVVDAFLDRFTLHLVLKINPQVDFSSGSNGWYIGRTVLANPENASHEILAEAFVHEAAHGYLYMLEALAPWMPPYEKSMEVGRNVASCWTGTKISLRSFSQAIFIWYTLYHFWQSALEKGIYNQAFVAERLKFIEAGFKKLQLAELQALAGGTIPEVSMAVFGRIQSEIVHKLKVES